MSTDNSSAVKVTVPVGGGRAIVGMWWSPNEETAQATIVIAPAMATKSSYYFPLAQWLSQRGFQVLTFDYSGYGESSDDRHIRAVTESAIDWAEDAREAVTFAHLHGGRVPTIYVGHSFGGQLVPFLRAEHLSGAMLIAAGSGYWRCNTPKVRIATPALWWVVAPLLVTLTGYFPGRRLGVIGDLPPRVMRQWARWCRSSRYMTVEDGIAARFSSVTIPVVSIWFTDDEILGERSFVDFANYFGPRTPELVKVTPKDLDAKRIGHHGIFRASHQEKGWEELIRPVIGRMVSDAGAAGCSLR